MGDNDMVINFTDIFPGVPSYGTMFMLEAMTYKATIQYYEPQFHDNGKVDDGTKHHKIEEIVVEAWTSQCDRFNPLGEWHAIPLKLYLETSTESGKHTLSYAKSEIITGDNDFSFTFRAKISADSDWVWCNGWQVNGFIRIELPRDYDEWTKGPNFDHIINSVHLGNFIAATNAKDCGFTHVLNVAENLDMFYEDGSVVYCKVPMRDGANNSIPDHLVHEAVQWLKIHDKPGNKILLNCRAGIGRAGSVATAYVFFINHCSYDEAYDYVFSRRFVYPHAGLKETLHRLFQKGS